MQEWAGARVELTQNIAAGVSLALVSALPTALQKYLPGIVAFPVDPSHLLRNLPRKKSERHL